MKRYWIPVILSALISAFLIAPTVYMIADNQPPFEYDAERSYVVPRVTESGRQMLVHWEFKRINRICPGSITRYVVDRRTTARFSYDPTPAATTVEIGEDHLDRTFFLPQEVPPGPKWYYATAEFACNPLQRFYPMRVQTPRLPFEVKE